MLFSYVFEIGTSEDFNLPSHVRSVPSQVPAHVLHILATS